MLDDKILSTEDSLTFGPGEACLGCPVVVNTLTEVPRLPWREVEIGPLLSAAPALLSCSLHACWGETAVSSAGGGADDAEAVGVVGAAVAVLGTRSFSRAVSLPAAAACGICFNVVLFYINLHFVSGKFGKRPKPRHSRPPISPSVWLSAPSLSSHCTGTKKTAVEEFLFLLTFCFILSVIGVARLADNCC